MSRDSALTINSDNVMETEAPYSGNRATVFLPTRLSDDLPTAQSAEMAGMRRRNFKQRGDAIVDDAYDQQRTTPTASWRWHLQQSAADESRSLTITDSTITETM